MLQGLQSRPLTLPVVWQWSITSLALPSPQIAQAPCCVARICCHCPRVRPYSFSSRSLGGILRFTCPAAQEAPMAAQARSEASF